MTMTGDLNSREHQKFIDAGDDQTAVRISEVMTTTLSTATIGSGVASGTLAVSANGMMYKVTQGVGTLSGTPGTITTYLKDSVGGTIATLAAQAESSTVTYSTTVPITTDMSWVVVASGDPDGTQNAAAGVPVRLAVHYQ